MAPLIAAAEHKTRCEYLSLSQNIKLFSGLTEDCLGLAIIGSKPFCICSSLLTDVNSFMPQTSVFHGLIKCVAGHCLSLKRMQSLGQRKCSRQNTEQNKNFPFNTTSFERIGFTPSYRESCRVVSFFLPSNTSKPTTVQHRQKIWRFSSKKKGTSCSRNTTTKERCFHHDKSLKAFA